ncbi:MAG: sulfatase-like hydrolase/transferase [Verrucomicrobiales bacterium]|nr:sulfatase-like hydrolase/transferase [Verrucomicrobiales bacterium]
MKLFYSGLIAIALGGGFAFSANTPRNIVFVMADDLGFEALSRSGAVSSASPNLDQLADDGISFRHAYSQPLCTPSRVKVMTGLSNRRNYKHFAYLDVEAKTFAHDLSAANYHTGIVGKWQLNGREVDSDLSPTERPKHFGFETWRLWQLADSGRIEKEDSPSGQRIDARYANPILNTDGEQAGPLEGEYGPELCLDWAKEKIEHWAQGDRPFLLYYPMMLTHGPFYPTPESEAWSDPEKRLSSRGKSQRYFSDMLAYADWVVGELRATLEAQGLAEDTWLIFTGDNGTDRKIKTLMENGEVIQGGKGQMLNRGTHVPLIAWRKGMTRPGRVSDQLVDFADIVPTFADIAGLPEESRRETDGVSFAGVLEPNGKRRQKKSVHVFYEANMFRDNRPGSSKLQPLEFVRNQRFKLYADGRFFDVSRDPEEEKALSVDKLKGEAIKAHALLVEELAPWLEIPDVLTR